MKAQYILSFAEAVQPSLRAILSQASECRVHHTPVTVVFCIHPLPKPVTPSLTPPHRYRTTSLPKDVIVPGSRCLKLSDSHSRVMAAWRYQYHETSLSESMLPRNTRTSLIFTLFLVASSVIFPVTFLPE